MSSISEAATTTSMKSSPSRFFAATFAPFRLSGSPTKKLATGSATVATVTAAGLMAATVAANPGLSPALLALSIGAGSMFFSHINDAGFWLVKEYMGMNLPDMFKSWSVLSTIISVGALVLIMALSAVM